MHALEARKHAQGSLEGLRLREVEFNDFIALRSARVLHVSFHRDGIALRNFQVVVRKGGVAESEAESIERLFRQVTISPATHGILIEWRNLFQRRIESQRKATGGIVVAGQRRGDSP